MIHWTWLLLAVLFGEIAGFIMAALLATSGRESDREEADNG